MRVETAIFSQSPDSAEAIDLSILGRLMRPGNLGLSLVENSQSDRIKHMIKAPASRVFFISIKSGAEVCKLSAKLLALGIVSVKKNLHF